MYEAAQKGTQNITTVLVLLFACCVTEEIPICAGKINLVSMQPSREHKSARDGKGVPARGLALSRLAGIPRGCGLKCSWCTMRQHTDKLNYLGSGESTMVCSAFIPAALFSHRIHNSFQRGGGIMPHGTSPFGSLIKATVPLHLHWHVVAAGLHLRMITQVTTTIHKVC